MPRPSTIDKLPEEVRAEIGRLRQNGRSIDEILAHLRKMDGIAPVSRSALGRHVAGLAKLGERIRRSREVATALVHELGDAPESQSARVGIELMQTAILDLFMRAEGDTIGGGEANAGGLAAVAGDPKGIHDLAKALDHLSRASRTNLDFMAAAEKRVAERAKREAVAQVETIGREKGISAETLNAIKAGIFGVKTEARPT